MKTAFKPLPDGEPMIGIPEFLQRLKHEPGFAEKMQAHYESQLALPVNEDTEDMHKAARGALRTLKHHQGAWHAIQSLLAADSLMHRSDFLNDRAILQTIGAHTDEAIDHLLDVMEPERTRLMARVTGIQTDIRDRLKEV